MENNWRANIVFFVIVLFGTAIIGRLFFLQIRDHEFYKALAQGQQKLFQRVEGERGEIFVRDKEGNLYKVAGNRNSPFLYASPGQDKLSKEEIESLSKSLSAILSLDKEFIAGKLGGKDLYEVIKPELSDEEFRKLQELGLKGVYIGTRRERFYPYGNFLSKVLGFVGGEGRGQYGIEEYWENLLRGQERTIEQEMGLGGSLFLPQDFGKGSDIILTIDYNIQNKAESLLEEAFQDLKIDGGQIIVADPVSGKILAMADFPAFNPNKYEDYARRRNLEIFQNSAIQKIFEPGSVFKPLTMAAAINENLITPWTKYIDKGFVKIGGYTIYNYDKRVWGERTMTEVLERSINTGAVFVEEKIGHEKFLEYIEKFGIFEKTGIGLAGEVSSQNKEFKKGYDINFATASFGQGIEMTPLQLVRAYSAIANGGQLINPYIVELESKPDTSNNKIISSQTSSKISAMLVSVVENGFAKAAKIDGYYIAGKTGTAQIPFSALGIPKAGYSDKTVQSFIGFFPAFDPKIIALVKLDNPQTKTAEYSAVPLFRKLAKYIIDYYQIPPDRE